MDSDRRPSRVPGPDRRAQSVFDYAIGASLFIVVVVGAIAFMPSAFSALGDDGGVSEGDRLIADRAAENLAESEFGRSPGGGLDVTCVVAYFEGSSSCGFRSGHTPALDAGVAERHPINVTIEADIDRISDERERLCWDSASRGLATVNSGNCGDSGDVFLGAGPSAEDNVNYVTASRAAVIGDQEVYILVRSW